MKKREIVGIVFMVVGFLCLVFTGLMLVSYRVEGRSSWLLTMLFAISLVIEVIGCFYVPNILLTNKVKEIIGLGGKG